MRPAFLTPVKRLLLAILTLVTVMAGHEAWAVETVTIPIDAEAINLTRNIMFYNNPTDRIAVSTAPGPDGIVRRIEVRSSDGKPARWGVVALSNTSDQQIDRLIVSPYYRLVKSRLIWPDLGESHIRSITPSQGFAPERQTSDEADVFQITLDPGTVVTLVFEISSPKPPQVTLWEPGAYTASINAYSLYKGIVLGISGLLAIVLTIVFVVKGTSMFPATAALAWAVLAYVAVDFYFIDDVLNVNLANDHLYRACSEVFLAFSLFSFLYAYLNLGRWHIRYSHAAIGLLVLLLGLFGVAVHDPEMAAGVARIALAVIGAIGLILIVIMAIRGYDRAIMLIPTWLLLAAWLVGAGYAVSGGIVNDIVQPALAGGLVLIVLLIGFTVMQHAFAGGSVMGDVAEMERAALALTGSGDPVWDWDVARDRIYTSRAAEESLGLEPGALQGSAMDWLSLIHPNDADRFRLVLDSIVEERRGRISETFRLRAHDGHYAWVHLRARPVVGADGEVIRCIGTLLDITDERIAQERMLHDAVHDNLTGLPNRELVLDRLETAIIRAHAETTQRPVVVAIGVDRFQTVNDTYGPAIGDSALLTLARRVQRLLKPIDTLARIGGDTFAVIVLSAREAADISTLTDEIRRQVRTPIAFSGNEINVSASIGVAFADGEVQPAAELLRDAELAMVHAKRLGGDRAANFTPVLRRLASELSTLEGDLGRALHADEVKIEFAPIIRLKERNLAGFELIPRWEHPRRGKIDAAATLEIAERAGLVRELGLFIIDRAVRLVAEWQEMAPASEEPLFAWINLPGRGLLSQSLVNDLKTILGRAEVPPGSLRLGVSEAAVSENPELAQLVLQRLHDVGAGLALNDIGADWSSVTVLHRVPFDALRIRTTRLKTGGGGSADELALLKTAAALAENVGAHLLVSGVESEGEAVKLMQIGCDFAQGRLFGPVLNADGARRFVGRVLALAGE